MCTCGEKMKKFANIKSIYDRAANAIKSTTALKLWKIISSMKKLFVVSISSIVIGTDYSTNPAARHGGTVHAHCSVSHVGPRST